MEVQFDQSLELMKFSNLGSHVVISNSYLHFITIELRNEEEICKNGINAADDSEIFSYYDGYEREENEENEEGCMRISTNVSINIHNSQLINCNLQLYMWLELEFEFNIYGGTRINIIHDLFFLSSTSLLRLLSQKILSEISV